MSNNQSTEQTARPALAIVFLLAALGLAFEVTLTRLFSLLFQYHYVFLIVSVSIAGLGIGAALAALMTRRSRATLDWADLVHIAILLVILLVGASLVLSLLRSSERTLVAMTAALLPFAGIGFLNAALFARFAAAGGVLYAADLLGGTVGLIAALLVIGWLGAFNTILALAVLAGLVAVLLAVLAGVRLLRIGAAGVMVGAGALLVINAAAGWITFDPDRLQEAPPDKTLLAVLDSDPSATITETRWGPFARLDVVETSDSALRYVFTDGGAGSTMVRYDGDDRRVVWLTSEVAYLPFVVDADTTGSALILGAGAGKDILMAHLAGIDTITAVEINPDLGDLTRDDADYNGGVYDLPGVETIVADGRNTIERSETHYDLIYANLVYSQAAAPGHSALAESYIFTREALRTYWDHLSESGRIGFVTHQGIEGLRLLVAALDMLQGEDKTLQEALRHVALVTSQSGDPQARNGVVLITRQPWTLDRANAFVEEAHARSSGMLYLPGYQELGLEGLVSGAITLDRYIDDNGDEFNFTPTTDDRPFFYQFRPGLPDQVSDLLLISVILTGVYLSWVMFFFVRRDAHWKRFSLTPHFALLGAAFMLVEIPLIQRFNLLVGQPSLGLVVVIGALLVGGGIGSLVSSRFPVATLPRRIAGIAAGVGLLVLLSLVVYPAVIAGALAFGLAGRVVVAVIALLPLGFLMGMPFPGGLRLAHEVDPGGVAAFWGANAVTSVLGSALAMALAITWGFSAALIAGAGLYGAVALLAWTVWPRLGVR